MNLASIMENQEEYQRKVLSGAPACGIWLMLDKITSTCKNTDYFTADEIEIIDAGLTIHEPLISVVLQRDPELYELALSSRKIAASFVMSIGIDDGKQAISVFENALERMIPPCFEKAFILIALFFDIPYAPANSLPIKKKREIMQDCRGFVNSMQVTIALSNIGVTYTAPDYCDADSIHVIHSGNNKDLHLNEKQSFGDQLTGSESDSLNASTQKYDKLSSSGEESIEVVQLKEKSKGVRFNFGEFEGYDGEEVHIALPEGTDTVGYNAFNCNYSVKTVVIPEGTTKIDMDAFEFAKISCIVLPSTLDTISFNAFRWCENLKEVVLPDGLTEIGSDAFSGCSGLKYIYIPDSVFDFGMDCFDDLDDCIFHVEPGSDAEEYIRENYEDYKIVYSKPAGYGNLPEIIIISKNAVVSADGFVTIEPDDGDVDSDYDGELTRYNGDAKKIRISDEFDTIESDAFAQNETIENVIIPDSVSSINSDAFSFCKNLKSIVLPNYLDIISSGLFWDCTNLEEVNIPDSVTEIEFNAFSGCKKIKIKELPNGIGTIGESAFAGCESLESMVLPEGLEIIEYGAFSGCTNLKKVTIPSSVCEIDETAFDFEQCVFFVEEGSYADEFLQGLESDVTIEYV